MFDSFSKASPMRPQPESAEDTPSIGAADGVDARLTQLVEQEQLWFSWVTVLHDRLSKRRPGEPVGEARTVLEIARRRWAEAKETLRQYQRPG
jgi:hypothetical protein